MDDVVVYGFEGFAQWGEELSRQASEEQMPDQVDVAGGGFDDGSPACGGQLDLGRPPVARGEVALHQAAAFHSPGVMRQAAPLPTDLGRQGADLYALVRYSAQGVEDVVIGKRQLAIGLELAVHFVAQPLLNPHIREPGLQFGATEPNRVCPRALFPALT
jgi:hypothetical protein